MLITDLKVNSYNAPNDYQYSHIVADLLCIKDGKVYLNVIKLKFNLESNSMYLITGNHKEDPELVDVGGFHSSILVNIYFSRLIGD